MRAIAVVAVTFDSAAHVEPFFASLAPALSGRPARVVVIDNASADDTVAQVTRCAPDASIFVNPCNRGYGAALNQGLAATGEELVVLANPDLTFAPGALDTLARWLESAPEHALAGPRGAARGFPSVGLEACELFLGHRLWPANPLHAGFFRPDLDRAGARPADCDWLVGACVVARRRALEEIGGFDPGYPLYFEETDLAWRLRARGWRAACVPEAVVHHAGGGSSQADAHALEDVYRASQRRFFTRCFGAPAADLLVAVQLAGHAFRLSWWGARALAHPGSRRRLAAPREAARRALAWIVSSRKNEKGRLSRGAP